MAWTSPMTAVAGDLFTAAEYNLYVRDNFLETAPAKATHSGGVFTVDAAHRITEKFSGSAVSTEEHNIRQCDSTYKDLQSAGPMVTVRTGTKALVTISAELMNLNSDAQASASFEVSGATRISASDNWRVTHDGIQGYRWSRQSASHMITNLTPGLNTFRMKYRTGALGPVYFRRREIIVLPF